jgi:hypothetical protein
VAITTTTIRVMAVKMDDGNKNLNNIIKTDDYYK